MLDIYSEWQITVEYENDIVINNSDGNIPPNAIAGEDMFVNYGDVVILDASSSYDSDGTIVSYAWSIKNSNEITQFTSTQQQFDYTFEIATSYTITLTVTDNSGGSGGWQGSIIVEENVVPSSGEDEEESNLLLYGGGAAVVLGLLGVVGLRYFRSEDEDDWGSWEETATPGPVNLQCPNCSGLITITTDQRPIQVGCPMCQAQFVIRE